MRSTSVSVEFDQSQAAAEKAFNIAPSDLAYTVLGQAYQDQNRFDEARAILREARASGIESAYFLYSKYSVDFLTNDAQGMAEDAAKGGPLLQALEADTAAYNGRISDARDLSQRAADATRQVGANGIAAGFQVDSALREALFGNPTQAKAAALEAQKLSKGSDIEGLIALALALAGETQQAQKLAADLDARFPEDTLVQSSYLPVIRGEIALQEKNPELAITLSARLRRMNSRSPSSRIWPRSWECCRSICVVRRIWPCERGPRPPLNSRNSSIIAASS